ncbi:MAG: hypothetical protein ABIE84_03970 [bacterium]
MKTMNNAQVIKTMEKVALHGYLKKLVDSQLQKITLFRCFLQNGRANVSDPVKLILIKDLKEIISLNSGKIYN